MEINNVLTILIRHVYHSLSGELSTNHVGVKRIAFSTYFSPGLYVNWFEISQVIRLYTSVIRPRRASLSSIKALFTIKA